jgi:HAMP domain-containing protein
MRSNRTRGALPLSLTFTALLLICQVASAQNVQGEINERSRATMTLQTQDLGNLVVILTPSTEVD